MDSPGLSSLRLLAVASSLGLSLAVIGCSAEATPDAGSVGGTTSVGGQGPGGASSVSDIDFETVPDLPAGAQVTVRVRVLPNQSTRVRFSLPPASGERDPMDAVLSQADVDTDSSGIAAVELTAPSARTSFELRASAGGFTKSTTVNVTSSGSASILVRPLNRYLGVRQITTWVASAYPDKTCAELPAIPTEDGPFVSLPAGALTAPQIDHVPADTPLAVTLRSGHFVGGCASVDRVSPGTSDNPQVVEVTVLPRPLNLAASELESTFRLTTPETTWGPWLEAGGSAVLQALKGTSVDDVDALLDAMREASPELRQSFELARQAEGWDAVLAQRWGASAATKLTDTCAAWLLAGRQRLGDADPFLTAKITPAATETEPASAELSLRTALGLAAADSGFVDKAQLSWSANSDDSVELLVDLYLVQSQVAERLAEAAKLAQDPNGGSAADRLARALDCEGLAAALTAAGSDDTQAFTGCASECMTTLCQSAVSTLWRRGADATGLSPARLSIIATGTARVGDAAQLAGLGGTWIGSLKTGDTTATTGGTVTLVAPSDP